MRSFGRGIFHKEPVLGAELGNKRVFRMAPGDLVFSNVFAWEGAVALATTAERGMIGSHRFLTYIADPDVADAAYLRYLFVSERGVALLRGASPGSAGRNRTLAIDRFAQVEIKLPGVDEQRRVAGQLHYVFVRLARLRAVLEQSRTRLGLLLQSHRTRVLEQLGASGVPAPRLDELAHIEMGQSPPGHGYNEEAAGLPLLNGPTDFGARSPSATMWTSIITKVCEPGDILFSVRASIGRMNWADRRYCIGRGLAAIRPNDGVVPSFLRHALAGRIRAVIDASAGSTFLNLSGPKLAGVRISCPPRSQQERLTKSLDDLEARCSQVQSQRRTALRISAALEASVLNSAFSAGHWIRDQQESATTT